MNNPAPRSVIRTRRDQHHMGQKLTTPATLFDIFHASLAVHLTRCSKLWHAPFRLIYNDNAIS